MVGIDWQYYSLTLLGTMEFSIKFDTVKPGWSFVYIGVSSLVIVFRCPMNED